MVGTGPGGVPLCVSARCAGQLVVVAACLAYPHPPPDAAAAFSNPPVRTHSYSHPPAPRPPQATFKNQGEAAFQDGVGRVVAEAAAAIPDGLLVFLPSYSLLDKLLARWKVGGDAEQRVPGCCWLSVPSALRFWLPTPARPPALPPPQATGLLAQLGGLKKFVQVRGWRCPAGR